MSPEEIHDGDSVLTFAGIEANFDYSKPDFVASDKRIMRNLENSRRSGGLAIVFIDQRDDGYSPTQFDVDNGFHYSLLGSAVPNPYLDGTFVLQDVLPLPVFCVAMGWGGQDKDSNEEYGKIEKSFREVINFLRQSYNGNLFIGSRKVLDLGGYADGLNGLPEASPVTLELLQFLSKTPEEIKDSDILEHIYSFRRTRPEFTSSGSEYIDDAELVQIMVSCTTGISRLGYPHPPRTREALRNYWIGKSRL